MLPEEMLQKSLELGGLMQKIAKPMGGTVEFAT
jgi:hypothetical protein